MQSNDVKSMKYFIFDAQHCSSSLSAKQFSVTLSGREDTKECATMVHDESVVLKLE